MLKMKIQMGNVKKFQIKKESSWNCPWKLIWSYFQKYWKSKIQPKSGISIWPGLLLIATCFPCLLSFWHHHVGTHLTNLLLMAKPLIRNLKLFPPDIFPTESFVNIHMVKAVCPTFHWSINFYWIALWIWNQSWRPNIWN